MRFARSVQPPTFEQYTDFVASQPEQPAPTAGKQGKRITAGVLQVLGLLAVAGATAYLNLAAGLILFGAGLLAFGVAIERT